MALDGSGTGTATSLTTISASLTTTNANDVICALVYAEAATQPSVTSVTATGLTFTQRARSHGSTRGNYELWWAPASATLSALSITAHFSGTIDDATIIVFGVSGCANTASPWDGNTSLPATVSNAATPSVTVSTSNARTFLIFGVGTAANWTQPGTLPSGFSIISSSHNSGGSDYAVQAAAYDAVSVLQSSTTFAWGSALPTTNNGNEAIFDALVLASAPSVPAPPPRRPLLAAYAELDPDLDAQSALTLFRRRTPSPLQPQATARAAQAYLEVISSNAASAALPIPPAMRALLLRLAQDDTAYELRGLTPWGPGGAGHGGGGTPPAPSTANAIAAQAYLEVVGANTAPNAVVAQALLEVVFVNNVLLLSAPPPMLRVLRGLGDDPDLVDQRSIVAGRGGRAPIVRRKPTLFVVM